MACKPGAVALRRWSIDLFSGHGMTSLCCQPVLGSEAASTSFLKYLRTSTAMPLHSKSLEDHQHFTSLARVRLLCSVLICLRSGWKWAGVMWCSQVHPADHQSTMTTHSALKGTVWALKSNNQLCNGTIWSSVEHNVSISQLLVCSPAFPCPGCCRCEVCSMTYER